MREFPIAGVKNLPLLRRYERERKGKKGVFGRSDWGNYRTAPGNFRGERAERKKSKVREKPLKRLGETRLARDAERI